MRMCGCGGITVCVCRGIGFPFKKSNNPFEVSANSVLRPFLKEIRFKN